VPTEWFHWLPASAVALFLEATAIEERYAIAPSPAPIERRLGELLAAVDLLRPDHRSLRAGWLWVVGRRRLGENRMQRVLHPLVTVPVRIQIPPVAGNAVVANAGDVTVTDLIADSKRRHELESGYEIGGGALDDVRAPEVPAALLARLERLQRFARDAADAAGFAVRTVVPVSGGPEELLDRDDVVIVAGVAIYSADEAVGLSSAAALSAWRRRGDLGGTAFHAVYRGGETSDMNEDDTANVRSPFVLTPAQRTAVHRAQHEKVSVVSGAAGTGKSRTVTAIACDALGRGQTVLVAAKTEAAVDALLDRLADAPGPNPVVFGSNERRKALAQRLADGELTAAGRADLVASGRRVAEKAEQHDLLVQAIADQLHAEAFLAATHGITDAARRTAPNLFDTSCDLTTVHALIRRAETVGGWWRARQAARALRKAIALSGASPETTCASLSAALRTARQQRVAGDLVARGGLDLADDWYELASLEEDVRTSTGEWLALVARSPDRLNRVTRNAVAVLGTALRSGRAARRVQLGRLDERVTRALPLWLGTLADVEDLLPPTPGLFDLVILDEASAIDQPLAAPALLRAKRAVVVGDPHQLRHVSFLGDEELEKAAKANGVDDPLLVGRLDVRRNSIFDVAIGAAPAITLDEHFRSEPHLVDFVARKLYGGRLQIATRNPATESCDCIDVIRVHGQRNTSGVVETEVKEVVHQLRSLLASKASSVGVISPFRAQADALESTILKAFSVDELQAMDLRVGTVHAFQGNERDIVIASLGIGEGDSGATWRFVEDPHLFAVLATRARTKMTIVLSAEPPTNGLVAGYLAEADAPPGRPAPVPLHDAWSTSIADGLSTADTPAIAGYPCGRHVVDVCAGDAKRFVGVESRVHPDGVVAHIERHMALVQLGWTLTEAHRSKWGERQGELLVEITRRLHGDFAGRG